MMIDTNVLDSDSGDCKLVRQSHNVLDPGPHSKAKPRDEREDVQGCDLLSTEPLIYVVLR